MEKILIECTLEINAKLKIDLFKIASGKDSLSYIMVNICVATTQKLSDKGKAK